MWKWFKWVLVVTGILFVGFLGFNYWKDADFKKSKTSKFITSNPVDLTQIKRISTFRSCMGHDYSGLNIDGISEDTRSMKHYVEPLEQFKDSINLVKIYAPFDGKVGNIQADKDKFKSQDPRFGGEGISFYPNSSKTWTMEFGHVYPLDSLKVGSEIKSGELIGYAYVSPDGGCFDLALWDSIDSKRTFSDDGQQTLDSILNHMSDEVYSQYAKSGLTKDNLIVTKEFRDAHPCQEEAGKINALGEMEVRFVPSDGDDKEMVNVIH